MQALTAVREAPPGPPTFAPPAAHSGPARAPRAGCGASGRLRICARARGARGSLARAGGCGWSASRPPLPAPAPCAPPGLRAAAHAPGQARWGVVHPATRVARAGEAQPRAGGPRAAAPSPAFNRPPRRRRWAQRRPPGAGAGTSGCRAPRCARRLRRGGPAPAKPGYPCSLPAMGSAPRGAAAHTRTRSDGGARSPCAWPPPPLPTRGALCRACGRPGLPSRGCARSLPACLIPAPGGRAHARARAGGARRVLARGLRLVSPRTALRRAHAGPAFAAASWPPRTLTAPPQRAVGPTCRCRCARADVLGCEASRHPRCSRRRGSPARHAASKRDSSRHPQTPPPSPTRADIFALIGLVRTAQRHGHDICGRWQHGGAAERAGAGDDGECRGGCGASARDAAGSNA